MPLRDEIDAVVALLSRFRLASRVEREMQDRIATVLERAGIAHIREHRLGRGPVDFFIPATGIAIEVKVAGGPSPVLKQLLDYVDEHEVKAIILVTTKPTHSVPNELRSKPAAIVKAWKDF